MPETRGKAEKYGGCKECFMTMTNKIKTYEYKVISTGGPGEIVAIAANIVGARWCVNVHLGDRVLERHTPHGTD